MNLIPLKAGLKQALDLSKSVLDPAKICLDNSPLSLDPSLYGLKKG
jgi:hypothetical protein